MDNRTITNNLRYKYSDITKVRNFLSLRVFQSLSSSNLITSDNSTFYIRVSDRSTVLEVGRTLYTNEINYLEPLTTRAFIPCDKW